MAGRASIKALRELHTHANMPPLAYTYTMDPYVRTHVRVHVRISRKIYVYAHALVSHIYHVYTQIFRTGSKTPLCTIQQVLTLLLSGLQNQKNFSDH